MKLWFFSDPHFGHRSTWEKFKVKCPDPRVECTKCDENGDMPMRPFTSTEEMDNTMISNINKIVKPEDHLYFLGDVVMKKQSLDVVKQINCRHLRLIMGNHDIYDYQDYLKVGFKKFMSYRVIDRIIFSHMPIHPGSMAKFIANVHGHLHNKESFLPVVKEDGKIQPYVNISVERTDYRPISLEEIKDLVYKIVSK